MTGKRSYLSAAFNACPWGTPIPPNWFVLVAFGLLGALVSPGLWLIGLGMEGLYLWTLSRHPRFRAQVDAQNSDASEWRERYQLVAEQLDGDSLFVQRNIESQAMEIISLLERVGASEAQVADVRHMVWLHMRLLAARASLTQVMATAARERDALEEQAQRLQRRLQATSGDDELYRSLQSQLEIIQHRRSTHQSAVQRGELVDAELERLRQQVALVREQALLATDEQSVAHSLDALSASLNEANRWLKDQRELFAGLDVMNEEPPPELWQFTSASVRVAQTKRKTGVRQ